MPPNEGDAIYHERQSLEMCLLHALNNLFQGTAYTKQTLNDICCSLSPESGWLSNPHRSMLGTGNYDVNVLMQALQTKQCTAVWFDRRKDPSCLDLDNVIGFVLNVLSAPKVGPITIPFYTRKHWICVRYLAGAFYNLDSKLDQPQIIGERDELLKYLTETLLNPETQVFVVVSTDVDADKSYLLPGYREDV